MNRQYNDILLQVKGVLEGEPDLIANLSNVAAILKTLPQYDWVGFYIVKQNELVLGPFQGLVACTRISIGKGVCGTSWEKNESILVPDVDAFPGHIACNALSRSEIVVPVRNTKGEVCMVIDVDSNDLNAFDENDVAALETIAEILTQTQNFPS